MMELSDFTFEGIFSIFSKVCSIANGTAMDTSNLYSITVFWLLPLVVQQSSS